MMFSLPFLYFINVCLYIICICLQRPQIAHFRNAGRAPGFYRAISNLYTSRAHSSVIAAGVRPQMVTNI